MANKVGAPPIYETPELMAQAVDLYFATCEAEKKKPAITRLAYALGFESRQSFYDYVAKPEFSYILKRANLLVEGGYEDSLREGGNPAGSIFALKNMGWKDKQENEVYGKDGAPIINIIMPKDDAPATD